MVTFCHWASLPYYGTLPLNCCKCNVFKWLNWTYIQLNKSNCIFQERCPTYSALIVDRSQVTWAPIRNNDIGWNFEKFLIGADGYPLYRYHHSTDVLAIQDDIVRAIADSTKARPKKPKKN